MVVHKVKYFNGQPFFLFQFIVPLFAEVLHTPAYIRREYRCPDKSPSPFS